MRRKGSEHSTVASSRRLGGPGRVGTPASDAPGRCLPSIKKRQPPTLPHHPTHPFTYTKAKEGDRENFMMQEEEYFVERFGIESSESSERRAIVKDEFSSLWALYQTHRDTFLLNCHTPIPGPQMDQESEFARHMAKATFRHGRLDLNSSSIDHVDVRVGGGGHYSNMGAGLTWEMLAERNRMERGEVGATPSISNGSFKAGSGRIPGMNRAALHSFPPSTASSGTVRAQPGETSKLAIMSFATAPDEEDTTSSFFDGESTRACPYGMY